MRKVITVLLVIMLMSLGCKEEITGVKEETTGVIKGKWETKSEKVITKIPISTTKNYKAKDVEFILEYLSNSGSCNTGLYKVTLTDGKEILIYKGSDYATMIQLK